MLHLCLVHHCDGTNSSSMLKAVECPAGVVLLMTRLLLLLPLPLLLVLLLPPVAVLLVLLLATGVLDESFCPPLYFVQQREVAR